MGSAGLSGNPSVSEQRLALFTGCNESRVFKGVAAYYAADYR